MQLWPPCLCAIIAGTNDQRYWRDPQLPFVESRLASGSRAGYVPHTHDTLSIGAVDSGHSNYLCGGDRARHGPGSLVLIPAERVHSCNPDTDSEWSYQMLHLDLAWTSAVLRESGGVDADDVLARPSINQDRDADLRYCALNGLLFSNADSAEKAARAWSRASRDTARRSNASRASCCLRLQRACWACSRATGYDTSCRR